MWQILKTEIDYNKRAITYAFIVGLLVSIAAGSISLNESERAGSALFTTGFLSVAMVVCIFLLIHLGNQDNREKRDCFHTLLSVSIKQLSFERLVFIVLVQSGFAVMLVVGSIVFNGMVDSASLFFIVSLQAFFFIITMLIAIFQDLGHFGTHKYRGIYLGLILVLNLAIVWLEFSGYRDTVFRFIFRPYTTAGGATVYTAIAIGMFYLSAGIFTRRKVYLQ